MGSIVISNDLCWLWLNTRDTERSRIWELFLGRHMIRQLYCFPLIYYELSFNSIYSLRSLLNVEVYFFKIPKLNATYSFSQIAFEITYYPINNNNKKCDTIIFFNLSLLKLNTFEYCIWLQSSYLASWILHSFRWECHYYHTNLL